MTIRLKLAAVLLALFAAAWMSAAFTQAFAQEADPDEEEHEEEVVEKPVRKVVLEELLAGTEIDFASAKVVFNDAILKDKSLKNIIARLEGDAENANKPVRYRSNALLLATHLKWNEGKMKEAQAFIEKAVKIDPNADALVMKGRILEAVGRTEQARDSFEQALKLLKDGSLKEWLHLRVTFTGVDQTNLQALLDLAQKRDIGFRNRTAVSMAILNRYDQATSIYQVDTKHGDAFRQHLRLAQWALHAKKIPMAQEHAWEATQLAKLERDRRFSLSVLVDAYEKDNALDKLLERLAAKPLLTPEEQTIRVEVLRKLKRYEEAIKLFLASAGTGGAELTPEAQTQLLRMYADAGRKKEMVAEYQKLIARHPLDLIWPEGLSQLLMEQNDKDGARQVWQTFITKNSDRELLLSGAESMAKFGFDDLAIAAAERCMTGRDESDVPPLMFLFDLKDRRGLNNESEAILTRLAKILPKDSMERVEVANGYERIGKQKEALAILEGLDRSLPNGLGTDDQMRLAWLYEFLYQRKQAYAIWESLWNGNAPAVHRTLIEERMLTLAAEIGLLGKKAVEIERKLVKGTANEKEKALLIRIYIEAGDTGGAVETIREAYEKKDGKETAESLIEQSKVYQALDRHVGYEKIMTRLLEVDPDNASDHLQALILNLISHETRKAEDRDESIPDMDEKTLLKLRRWLAQMEALEGEAASGQFAAGILEMAGFDQEAIDTYRKVLAEHPADTDNHLLLAAVLGRNLRLAEGSASLQYQVESAERDDAFVVALDGMINLNPKMNSVNGFLLRWMQRRALERIITRDDKLYLYEVLAEVAQAANDMQGYLGALENSLAYANSRRSTVLRELVAATQNKPVKFGRVVQEFVKFDLDKNQTYSKRLLALGEELPPSVYMDVGRSLLKTSDLVGATEAFNKALDRSDRGAAVEEVGDAFKSEGFNKQAMVQYERALISDADNIGLLYKLADTRDLEGFPDEANRLYLRAMTILIRSQTLEIQQAPAKPLEMPKDLWNEYSREYLDSDYREYYWHLMAGFVRTLPADAVTDASGTAAAEQFQAIEQLCKDTLKQIAGDAPRQMDRSILRYPRMYVLSQFARVAAFRGGQYQFADKLDGELLQYFGQSPDFVGDMVRMRHTWGLMASARQMAAKAKEISSSSVAAVQSLLVAESEKGLDVAIPSPALFKQALQRKEFERAAGIAQFLNDQALLMDAYRAWYKAGLQSGDDWGGVNPSQAFTSAQLMLPPAQYSLLCNELFEFAGGRPEFSKKVLLMLSDRGTLDIEKAAGKEFLNGKQVSELLAAAGDKVMGERGWYNIPYLMRKLPLEQQVDFLSKYLSPERVATSQNFGSSHFSWETVFEVLENLLTKPLDSRSAERIANAIKAGVDKALSGMDHELPQHIQSMGRWDSFKFTTHIHRANVAWVEDLEGAILSKYGDKVPPGILKLRLFLDTGRTEEAVPLLLANLRFRIKQSMAASYSPGSVRNYEVRVSSFSWIAHSYKGPEYAPLIAKALAKLEAEEPGDKLTLEYFALEKAFVTLKTAKDPQAMIAWLSEKSKRYPDNDLILGELRTAYAQLGYIGEEMAVLERLVKLAPDNTEYRWRLFSLWQGLDNPVQALETATGQLARIKQYDQDQDSEGMSHAVYKMARTYSIEASPTAEKALKALAAASKGEDPQQGARALRTLWQSMPIPSMTLKWNNRWATRMRGLPSTETEDFSPDYINLKLPAVLEADVELTGLTERYSQEAIDWMNTDYGRLLVDMAKTDSLDIRPRPPAEKLLAAAAKRSFSIPEFEAFIRVSEPGSIDTQSGMYELLTDAYVANGRADAEFKRLTQEVAADRADIRLWTLWLNLLTHQSQQTIADQLPMLEQKLVYLGVPNPYFQALLARVYAKGGRMEQAADLYTATVLSVLAAGNPQGVDGVTEHYATQRRSSAFFRTITGLYADANKHISGPSLDRMTTQVLRAVQNSLRKIEFDTMAMASDGRYTQTADDGSRYQRFVMTLLEQYPDSAVLKTEFKALTARKERAPLKNPFIAVQAVRTQVQSGDIPRALQSLQAALQLQYSGDRPLIEQSSRMSQEEVLGYARDEFLEPYYESASYVLEKVGRPANFLEFMTIYRQLFLAPLPVETDRKVWYATAAKAIAEWAGQGAFDRNRAIQILCALVYRQKDAGATDDARNTAQSMGQLLAQPETLSQQTASLALSAINATDAVVPADTLRNLIRLKRVDVPQLVTLIKRIGEKDGPAAALSLGEMAVVYSLNTELLRELQSLCLRVEAKDSMAQQVADPVKGISAAVAK